MPGGINYFLVASNPVPIFLLIRMNKTVRKWVEGVAATALAIVAMSIFAKIVWNAWDQLIAYLVSRGVSPAIEYVLGGLLFILAIWLGAVQLKKLKKKVF